MAKKKIRNEYTHLSLFMELPFRNDIIKIETNDPLNDSGENCNFDSGVKATTNSSNNDTEQQNHVVVDKIRKEDYESKYEDNKNDQHFNDESNGAVEKSDKIESEKRERIKLTLKKNKVIITKINNVSKTIQQKDRQCKRIQKVNFYCDFCDLELKSTSEFVLHGRKFHYSNEHQNLICRNCKKIFKNFKNLITHFRKKHKKPENLTSTDEAIEQTAKLKNKLCLCHICGKIFNYVGQYREHILMHENVKNYICSACSKPFISKRILTIHSRIHDVMEDRKFVCGFIFENESMKKSHIPSSNYITIDDEGRSVCNFTCVSKSDLSKHSLVHLNLKPYACHLCTMSFRQTSHLKRHIKRHLGAKDFICDVCKKEFVTKDNLSNHLLTHIASHICEICGKTLLQRGQCVKHVAKCHSNKIQN